MDHDDCGMRTRVQRYIYFRSQRDVAGGHGDKLPLVDHRIRRTAILSYAEHDGAE